MSELPELIWSDAWILEALCFDDRRELSLRDLIGIADGIQHACLEFGELDSGLFRLAAHGLVEPDGPPFRATQKAREIVDAVRKAHHQQAALSFSDSLKSAIDASSYAAGPRLAPWSADSEAHLGPRPRRERVRGRLIFIRHRIPTLAQLEHFL